MKLVELSGSFLLALYTFIGFFILIYSHGQWYESMIEMGLHVFYVFNTTDALPWSISTLPGCILIFLLTYSFKHDRFIATALARALKRERLSIVAKPYIAALTNLIVISTMQMLLSFFIPGFWNPFIIIYMFVLAGIVSVSTYYYVFPPAWELFQSKDVRMELEALKLEHEVNWKIINIISWVITFLAISAVFALWTQIIFPSIPMEKRVTMAAIKVQVMSGVQISYLIIGVWFGILGPLIDYSWRIRKRIAEL
jgi:hypothetical protein